MAASSALKQEKVHLHTCYCSSSISEGEIPYRVRTRPGFNRELQTHSTNTRRVSQTEHREEDRWTSRHSSCPGLGSIAYRSRRHSRHRLPACWYGSAERRTPKSQSWAFGRPSYDVDLTPVRSARPQPEPGQGWPPGRARAIPRRQLQSRQAWAPQR